MPLREVGEYHAWSTREGLSRAARSAARTFIAELGDVPWRAPSGVRPVLELTGRVLVLPRPFARRR